MMAWLLCTLPWVDLSSSREKLADGKRLRFEDCDKFVSGDAAVTSFNVCCKTARNLRSAKALARGASGIFWKTHPSNLQVKGYRRNVSAAGVAPFIDLRSHLRIFSSAA